MKGDVVPHAVLLVLEGHADGIGGQDLEWGDVNL